MIPRWQRLEKVNITPQSILPTPSTQINAAVSILKTLADTPNIANKCRRLREGTSHQSLQGCQIIRISGPASLMDWFIYVRQWLTECFISFFFILFNWNSDIKDWIIEPSFFSLFSNGQKLVSFWLIMTINYYL